MRPQAGHCHTLTNVDFTVCTRLTDAAIIALAERCPALHSLNVALRCLFRWDRKRPDLSATEEEALRTETFAKYIGPAGDLAAVSLRDSPEHKRATTGCLFVHSRSNLLLRGVWLDLELAYRQ